jgi:hypothetical protein
MHRSLRPIPVTILSAVALAACGSASNKATVPSIEGNAHPRPSSASGLAGLGAWQAAVQCARRHGMPRIPDPVLDASGHPSIPGGAPTLTPAVTSACGNLIRAIGGSVAGNPVESSSDIHALLRVAACMRGHGFPHWPDPNDRGEFHLRSADAGTPASEGRAITACNSLFPPSGWHLIVTPSGR